MHPFSLLSCVQSQRMATEMELDLALPAAGVPLGVRISQLNEVTDLKDGGVAAAAGLLIGDRIVAIDEVTLVAEDGSLMPATSLLKRDGQDGVEAVRRLVLLRRSASASDDHSMLNFLLTRDDQGSLGFNVTEENCVSALKPGGVAEAAGMHLLDRIVEVDGSPVPHNVRLGTIMLRSRATYTVGVWRVSDASTGEARAEARAAPHQARTQPSQPSTPPPPPPLHGGARA